MSESFESVQADSRSKSTKLNYEKRIKRFFILLKAHEPLCWDNDSDEAVLSEITTTILLKYIAVESFTTDSKMKSYSTPEGCHSAILAFFSEEKCEMPGDFNREWIKFSGIELQESSKREICPLAGQISLVSNNANVYVFWLSARTLFSPTVF